LEEQKEDLRGRFGRESPWWVPEAIDERIFEKLYGGLRGFIHEVVDDPKHELRDVIDGRIAELVENLQHDPALVERGEALKEELLADPALRAWTASMWDDLRRSLLAQAGDPGSPLRQRLASAAQAFGERLAADPALQARVDGG